MQSDVFVSDFGCFSVPAPIAAALEKVPRRKAIKLQDSAVKSMSRYDRRYRIGRAAEAWERRQNTRIGELWKYGREGEFVFEPFAVGGAMAVNLADLDALLLGLPGPPLNG